MEKKRPTYDLNSFKTWASGAEFEYTRAALSGAQSMGMSIDDMRGSISKLQRSHFYKSVTSHNNHKKWQDVYHLPLGEITIYIKFIDDVVSEFRLLSFKEK